jgi:transcriptional regulator with XRE-family HTH domain
MSRKRRPAAYSFIQEQIGARIEWARELVYANRSEFARLLGVDASTIKKIETGERPPSVFNVIEIAHRLRVSTEYILRGSLVGVDPELAALLVARHPELLAPPRTEARTGTAQPGGKRTKPS